MRPEGLNNAAAGGLILLMLSTGMLNELLTAAIPATWTANLPPHTMPTILHGLAAFSGALFVGGLLHAGWEVPTPSTHQASRTYIPPVPARLQWALYITPLIITVLMTIMVLHA